MNGIGLSARHEFPHLASYLETQIGRQPEIGAVIGTTIGVGFGLAGGMAGALAGTGMAAWLVLGIPAAIAATALGVCAVWLRKRMKAYKEVETAVLEARPVLGRLFYAMNHVGLRQALGDSADLLEEGAKMWRDSMTALSDPAWTSAEPGSALASASARARAAIDAAMARLVMLIGDAGREKNMDEARALLEQMEETLQHARSVTGKLAHRDGSAEDERDRLRRAMQELRQPDDALEEVQSLEQR